MHTHTHTHLHTLSLTVHTGFIAREITTSVEPRLLLHNVKEEVVTFVAMKTFRSLTNLSVPHSFIHGAVTNKQ